MGQDNVREALLEEVFQFVDSVSSKKESQALKAFIKKYYHTVSTSDLLNKSSVELYELALSHWYFFQQRESSAAKIRVFNPKTEVSSSKSPHTVIEIVCDQMPFVLNSIRLNVLGMGVNIHSLINLSNVQVQRDESGVFQKFSDEEKALFRTENLIHLEIDKQIESKVLQDIKNKLEKVFLDLQLSVEDWPTMKNKLFEVIPSISQSSQASAEFLQWILEEHFIFLGYDFRVLEKNEKGQFLRTVSEDTLGILKSTGGETVLERPFSAPTKLKKSFLVSELLTFGRSKIISNIRCESFVNFISVKKTDHTGRLVGEHRFFGLYTTRACHSDLNFVPLFNEKLKNILCKSGFQEHSEEFKSLANIINSLPREDFFQAPEEAIMKMVVEIYQLQFKKSIKLFVLKDKFEDIFSCFVYLPQDGFDFSLTQKIKEILVEFLKGSSVVCSTTWCESGLARVHVAIKNNDSKTKIRSKNYDFSKIEQKLILASRTWAVKLEEVLKEKYGEENGNALIKMYKDTFCVGYSVSFSPRIAVMDIKHLEHLRLKKKTVMNLYGLLDEHESHLKLKLYRSGNKIALSDMAPILENMGLQIISEQPYELKIKPDETAWINDYKLSLNLKCNHLKLEEIKELFQESLEAIWMGDLENDGFNQLILSARLSGKEITILRSYAKYLWQIGSGYSQETMEETMANNPQVARSLVELFSLKFIPEPTPNREQKLIDVNQNILNSLEAIDDLTEDKIIKKFLNLIHSSVRTNFFQRNEQGEDKPCLSIKFDSSKVMDLPLPHPFREIFVYSTCVEGIHKRCGQVARGGIRWSDRKDDYNIEISGLMKTQQVKNAVIVPMGAKGGFIVKKNKMAADCYEIFIQGLLDVTDNIDLLENKILKPKEVLAYDADDPYLVVAADKGTATFSDLANDLSLKHGFWLGDAFASGGSTGYDHKKLGITARGAWESVKRHFLDLGHDLQQQPFTVIGIGDMSGDVFGNGMLLSDQIQLIAAFNHEHIFLDPNPDPAKSFLERKRLFEKPGSTWSDYDPQYLSPGGGVYSRGAKLIALSPEIRLRLKIHSTELMPSELIKAVLKAPVNLLWNGGIGTFVKASYEKHADAGDRSNDSLRINADELRCQVVGEGGNLGFTQFARIEYAMLGGRINTDAIDNSGGVNCSDNEVNIKILLNSVVQAGELTQKQRNKILEEMTPQVIELVLKNNQLQNEAISIAVSESEDHVEMHGRLIEELEKSGKLNRTLECLPTKEEIQFRKSKRQGLTRPEIAVLIAYSKNSLKMELLDSKIPEESYALRELKNYFPSMLSTQFSEYLLKHRLKREIIATQWANIAINEMGINFITSLSDETGASAPETIQAFMIAREIFNFAHMRFAVLNLKNTIEVGLQLTLLNDLNRFLRRTTRWFLRNRRTALQVDDNVAAFKTHIQYLFDHLFQFLTEDDQTKWSQQSLYLQELGLPLEIASKMAGLDMMYSALDVVDAAVVHRLSIDQVAPLYFAIGEELSLGWLREQIKEKKVKDHWEAWARAVFRDDLDKYQRDLSVTVLDTCNDPTGKTCEILILTWLQKNHQTLSRWYHLVEELKRIEIPEFTMFSVALRELWDLSHVG